MKQYHFHIYYDASSRKEAQEIHLDFEEMKYIYDVIVGQMWDKPMGPHTKPQFVLHYIQRDTDDSFKKVYDYLLSNRNGLSVLIHPADTTDELEAHTTMAVWMGDKVPLDLTKL